MTAYLLTDAAEADLRGVIRYTRAQWDSKQVRRYIGLLEVGMTRVAAGQGHFKPLNNIALGLRMAHCEHHYVFCLCRASETPLIVAILHERMDLITRLGDRIEALGDE